MCRVLGVSRSGFYAWERRAPCDRALEDAWFKKERVHRQPWPTRGEVRTATFEYVGGWHNRRRRHSTLDYLSLLEFEEQRARGESGLIARAGAAA